MNIIVNKEHVYSLDKSCVFPGNGLGDRCAECLAKVIKVSHKWFYAIVWLLFNQDA